MRSMFDAYAIETLIINILNGSIKTRQKCAIEYAGVIRAAEMSGIDYDVTILNDVIVIRWSRSGLDFIKKKAWAMAYYKPAKEPGKDK